MANRLNNPNQFESLSPPWLLTQLDTNFTQNQAAWNDSSLGFINGIPVDTGSANAYTIALPFGASSANQDGTTYVWIPNNTNTGASTLTVTPLGSAAILTPAGNALQGGELSANRPVMTVYKTAVPTGFRIVGPCPLSLNLLAQSGNISIECAGYTSIAVQSQWTSGSNLITTLSHLAQGVPVLLEFVNGTGANTGFAINATSPGGTAFTDIQALPSGTANGASNTNMISGIVINSATPGMAFMGGAIGPLALRFLR